MLISHARSTYKSMGVFHRKLPPPPNFLIWPELTLKVIAGNVEAASDPKLSPSTAQFWVTLRFIFSSVGSAIAYQQRRDYCILLRRKASRRLVALIVSCLLQPVALDIVVVSTKDYRFRNFPKHSENVLKSRRAFGWLYDFCMASGHISQYMDQNYLNDTAGPKPDVEML